MNEDELINALSSDNQLSESEDLRIKMEGTPTELVMEIQRKKIERQSEEIENIKQDRSQRKIFSYCIFAFMCLYMAASLTIVFMCGLEVMSLKESILITLLTTTLANVIGVFNFVAKYLFHK